MIVSPKRRIMVIRARSPLRQGDGESLVVAKNLTSLGVRTIQSRGTARVQHMAWHGVFLAAGIWMATFPPEDQRVNGTGTVQRSEILEVPSDLRCAEGAAACRPGRSVVETALPMTGAKGCGGRRALREFFCQRAGCVTIW